jgi:membrane fusion protein (multidrug efflux system)
MRKRMILMLAAVVALIAVLAFVKFMQIRAAIAAGSSFQMPPEAVTTIVATREEWPATLSSIGSVAAVHGVTVSADLPGIVQTINIDSGRRVKTGEVLVRLDASQEQSQLKAAEAAYDLAKLNLERGEQLLQQQVIAKAEYDQLTAAQKQAEARVGEIRATIQRKTIRAPFSGVLGLRQINLGQYLNAGDPVVSLQSMDPVYINFSVPQQDESSLKVGDQVTVIGDSVGAGRATGRITAINSIVDEATRNVQVQATFKNPRNQLHPGMFVDVQVALGTARTVVSLPASAINYAPYGNSVFIVDNNMKDPKGKTFKGVRQEFVTLGTTRGDLVSVLSGVKPGEEVVTSGVFKLRNGAAVMVNNTKQPSSNPAPKPEDS